MAYTPTSWLTGNTVTAALLNNIETELVALDAVAPTLTADATGTTDIGVALQAAFDASPVVNLKPNGIYLLNTSVFLDSTNARTRYVLNMNGATLKLGTGLSKAAEFVSPNTKWGFFNGTVRAALSAGTVTNSLANLASTPAFPSQPRLLIVNGIVDGQNNDVGLAYGNTSATLLYRLVAYQLKWGISWAHYADGNGARNVHVASQVTGGSLIKQEDNGDGVILDGCKATGGNLWDATNCNGGKVVGCIAGGFTFANCWNIEIDATHNEQDEAGGYTYAVTSDRSQITINDHFSMAGKAASKYTFIINDSTSSPDSATDLTLRNCVSTFYIRTTDTDPGRDPSIYVTAANNGARVRAYDCRTMVWAQRETHPPRYREGWLLGSADSNIQTAITAGQDQISTGSFELRRIDGAWQVRPPFDADLAPRPLAAPTLTVAVDTNATGALTNGQAYFYVAAVKNVQQGIWSSLSSTVSATAGTDGSIALALVNPSSPCVVGVWRKTGSGVATAPDRYLEVPLDGYQTHWWDTGTKLNGRAWLTSSLPVPNTVAGSGAAWTRLERALLARGESTIPRLDAASSTSTISTGAARYTYFTARKTESISQIRMISGGTASTGATLIRVGIYTVDYSGALTLIASTPNDTALLAATNTAYTKALSVAFTKTAGVLYAVGVLCVGAAPAILADALASAASNFTLTWPPLVSGQGSLSDLASTVAAGSLSAQTAPLYVELLP